MAGVEPPQMSTEPLDLPTFEQAPNTPIVGLTLDFREWLLDDDTPSVRRRFAAAAPGFPEKYVCIGYHDVNHRSYWMKLGLQTDRVYSVQSPRFSLTEDMVYCLRKQCVSFASFAADILRGQPPFEGPAIEGLAKAAREK
jgi:hypothetical protein